MSIEIQARNDTEARHSISIYPIPAPIRLPPARGLTRAEFPEIDTGELQKISLSIDISVIVGKESPTCRE
jgi:hypothetical protein